MTEPLERASISILPTPPFDFNITASYATYFRGRYGADHFENGLFRRLLDIDGRLCLVSTSSNGKVDDPRLSLEISAQSLDENLINAATKRITRILNVQQDLTPFYRRASSDKVLERLARTFYGLHVPQTASVFEGLILAILGQQISYQVAFKLRTGLIRAYGSKIEINGTVYSAFPQPAAIIDAGASGLRTIGLSTRKTEYVLDIARGVADRCLNLEALREHSDADIISSLNELRGVGNWTAQWLLIRSFGRSDGFPVSDLVLLRMIGRLMGKNESPSIEEAIEYSQRWSPFRSYVTSYLFAAARSGNLDILNPV